MLTCAKKFAMYYKLSNIADEKALFDEFGVALQYNDVHRSKGMINGLSEETVLAITTADKNQISPAIWGMLPKEFTDDWNVFQNISNTLNIPVGELREDNWKAEALESRRCLIVVTGFFTTYLHKGTLHPYYVYRKDRRPFSLAGVYTCLDDGFLTCSLITSKADYFIKKIHNVSAQMPVIISTESRPVWLDESITAEVSQEVILESSTDGLKAHLIAKEFFNKNITYDSMLEPVSYNNLEPFVKP